MQNEHLNATARKIALQTEEKSAIKKYIICLRDEIESQIQPLKPGTGIQYKTFTPRGRKQGRN